MMPFAIPPGADRPVACDATEGFAAWLAASGGSLALTTYQAGKVGDAKLCPQIQSAAVETKGTTLEATQLVLQEVNRSPLKIAPTGSSKSCLSDMICPTEDSFDIDSDTLISIMRNNDGGYPTTDLAGYSQLKITAITSPGKSMTCVYSLLSVR